MYKLQKGVNYCPEYKTIQASSGFALLDRIISDFF